MYRHSMAKKIIALLFTSAIAMEATGCSLSKSLDKQYDFSETTVEINRKERQKEEHMGKKGTWTVFVYLCGSNLESSKGYASGDMEEMIESSANDDIQFVVETGGSSKWFNDVSADKNQRYVIKNGKANLVKEIDAANMGDSKTLADFLNWGVENYPAYNMGLVMWDHGGGCIYGACSDETADGDQLYLKEIDAALYDVYDNMTDKFEFIGFDACLMSTVETAAILATHADYMIASEESESGYGWDYKAIGDFLAENPKSDGLELGKKICDSFYQSCEDYGFAASATMSVVDLSKMDTLLKGFDVYSQKLYQAIHNDSGFTNIARNIFSGDQFGSSGRGGSSFNLIDMGQLISSGMEYIDKSNDVLSALEDTVAYKVNGSQHENASGLSIYYPISINSSDELDIFSDICVSPYYLAFVNDALYKELQITANALEKLLSLYTNDYSGSGYTSDYHYSISQNEIWDAADDYNNNGDSDLIAYADKPTLDTSGHYGFTLTEDALQVTDHVEANIYTWNEKESTLFELGYSGEVNADYTTGKFSDKFDGNWFYLPDGQLLSAYYVDSANGSSTYTAPVMLNGEESNLRFIYNAEDHTAILVDAWNGTDGYGNASRSNELKKGDKIVPIYHPYTKYGSSKKNYTGKEYKLTGEKQLKYQKLNAGEYWYSFDIYDIYGNYKETDPVMFHVKDSGLAFSDETHIWKEATCTEPKTCMICGATEGEAAGHQWKEATCTAPKTCTVCGETEGEALGHDWIEATITAPKTCSRCGETEGEPLSISNYSALDFMSVTKSDFSQATGDAYHEERGCDACYGSPDTLTSSMFPGYIIAFGNGPTPHHIHVLSGKITNSTYIGMTLQELYDKLGTPDEWEYWALDGYISAAYTISGVTVGYCVDDRDNKILNQIIDYSKKNGELPGGIPGDMVAISDYSISIQQAILYNPNLTFY